MASVGIILSGTTQEVLHAQYQYDSLERLVSIYTDLTPGDGNSFDSVYSSVFTYDGSSNRILTAYQTDGSRLQFTYQLVGADYKIKTVTDALGATTTFDYSLPNSTAVTDPLGAITIYRYDPLGQLTAVSGPMVDGTAPTTTFEYNLTGDVTRTVDARGLETVFSYDGNGNRVYERDGAGNTVTRTYNLANNQILTETRFAKPDPDGSGPAGASTPLTTRYVYDSMNRLRFVISAAGQVQEHRYNALSQRRSDLTYLGTTYPATTAAPSEAAMLAWLAQSTTDTGNVQHIDYTYDARGQLAASTTYAAAGASGTNGVPGLRDETTQLTLPPEATRLPDGSIVLTSTNQAASTQPCISGPDHAPGTSWRFEVTTPAAITDGLLSAGMDSGVAGTGTAQQFRVLFGTDGIQASVQAGSSSIVPLGAAKPNTTYVVELATTTGGMTMAYVYEKGADRASGASFGATFATGQAAHFAASTTCGPTAAAGTAGSTNTVTIAGVATQTTANHYFTYDAEGLLRQSIDGDGNLTGYSYDGLGRLLAATDAANNTIRTIYHDSSKTATQSTAAGLITTSVYDRRGALLSQTSSVADGPLRSVRNVYDKAGRLRQTITNDLLSSFIVYDAAGRKTGDIDERGQLTEYRYNADGQVTRTIRYVNPVDTAGLVDATGAPTQSSVASLRPTANTDDRSSWNVYDNAGRLSMSIDPNGSVTEYTYDGQSNLTTRTQRFFLADVAALASQDQPVRPSIAASSYDRTTTLCYDADSRMVGKLDADGYLTEYRYAGSLLVETIAYFTATPLTTVQAYPGDMYRLRPTTNNADIHTRNIYNAEGQVSASVDGENYLTTFDYDGAGNLVSKERFANRVTSPAGSTIARLGMTSSTADQVTTYGYTVLNQLQVETAPDGTVTRYSYDANGKLTELRRASGSTDERLTLTRHDALGRVTAQLSAVGAAGLAAATSQEAIDAIWKAYATTYTYNGAGLRLSTTDPAGHRTVYYYDKSGNLQYTINGEGEVEARVYDGFSQLREIHRVGRRLTPADLAGLNGGQADAFIEAVLDTVRGPADSIETYKYDIAGRMEDHGDASGYHTIDQYNAFGEVITQALENTAHDGYIETDYRYDRRGNLVNTIPFTDPALTTYITYDSFSRVTANYDAYHNGRTDGYDRLGRVVSSKDKIDPPETTTYDAFGRVLRHNDSIGATWIHTYDDANRQFTLTTPEGVKHTTTLDRLGQTVSVVDTVGNVTNYAYDKDGHLTVVTDAAGTQLEGHTYNANGTVATNTDGNGIVTRIDYDAASRVLTRTVDPKTDQHQDGLDLVTSFTYNAAGKVATVTDPNRIVTETLYDEQLRVKTITQDKGGANRTTSYTYDSRGNIASITDPNGALTTVAESETGFGKFTQVPADGGQPAEQLFYDRTGANVVLRATGADHRTVTRYAYNENNQLVYEVDPEGAVTGYSYDKDQRLVTTTRFAARCTLPANWSDTWSAADIGGMIAANPAADQVKRIVYDREGRVYATIDASGIVTANLSFDTADHVTSQTTYATALDADSLASITSTTSAYALNSLIVAKKIPDRARDIRHMMFYDDQGRLASTLTSIDSNAYGQPQWLLEVLRYDGNGNLTERTTTKPIVADPPTAAKVATFLSSPGNALPTTSVRMLYDHANRLVATATFIAGTVGTTSLGSSKWTVVRQDFDANGNVLQRRTGLQALEVMAISVSDLEIKNFSDNMISSNGSMFVPLSDPAPSGSVDGTLSPAFIITTNEPGGTPACSGTTYVYDSANRAVASATMVRAAPDPVTGASGFAWAIVANQYDAAGNLVGTTAYATPLVTSDAITSTRIASFIQGDSASYAADRSSAFVYDDAHRLIASAVAQGTDLSGAMQWAVTGYQYDSDGNLLKRTEYATLLSTGASSAAPDAAVIRSWVGQPGSGSTANHVTRYGYDGQNRVTTMIAADGAVTGMRYDTHGNLTARTQYATPDKTTDIVGANYSAASADGDRTTRTVYDQYDKVVYEIDAAGAVTGHDYDALGRATGLTRYAAPISLAGMPAAPTITDISGRLTRNAAADRGETYVLDKQGRVQYAIDAGGYVTENQYSPYGKCLATLQYKAPLPTDGSVTLAALVANKTGAVKTSYEYDALGNVLTETRSAPDVPTSIRYYGYDAQGHNTSLLNEALSQWTYEYDLAGRMIRETSPAVMAYTGETTAASAALVTRIDYDAFGDVLARTEAEGVAGKERTTSYGYDLAGRQNVTKLGSLAVYDSDKDSLGVGAAALPTATDERNATASESASGERATKVTYDAFGNAWKNTDAAGNTTYRLYDKLGRVVYEVDALGYVTGYERNTFGEATKLTRYAGLPPAAACASADAMAAALAAMPSTDNRSIVTDYDKLGRAVHTTEGLAWVYDPRALDNAPAFTAARVTATNYNAFGQVVAQLSYGVDASGKVLTQATESRSSYDTRGNKTAQFDVLSQSTDVDGKSGVVTTFAYDYADRMTKSVEVAQSTTGWTDAGMAPPAVLAGDDRETDFAYDSFGRKTGETRRNVEHLDTVTGLATHADIVTTFQYDKLGNQTAVIDALQGATYTFRDALGRVTAVARVQASAVANLQSAPTELTEYRLDILGNALLGIVRANGVASVTPGDNGPTYVAGAVSGDDRKTFYTYNLDGRVVQAVDAENHGSFTSYDKLGRVAKEWREVSDAGARQISYNVTRYDGAGRVTDTIAPGNLDLGATTAAPAPVHRIATYNQFGEVTRRELDSGDGLPTVYEETSYDNLGRAWRTSAGDGIDKVRLFDVQGQVTVQVVSEDPAEQQTLRGATSAAQAALLSHLLRTETSYDLLGHVVDAEVPDTRIDVLQRSAAGTWTKLPLENAAPDSDTSLIVVGDSKDAGKTVSVTYRRDGDAAWTSGSERLENLGGFVVFSTAGLAGGSYDYQVSVDGVQRDQGLLVVTATPSTSADARVIELYSVLLDAFPDQQAMNDAVARLNQGVGLATIAADLLNSNKARQRLTGSATDILTRIFRDAFGRTDPDTDSTYAADLGKWVAQFGAAGAPYTATGAGQAIVDLIASVRLDQGSTPAMLAARTRLASRTGTGVAYLVVGGGNDVKDAASLYSQATGAAAPLTDVAASAALLDKQRTQLSQLYVTLLRRPPDTAGMQFWLDGLQAHTTTMAQVATDMLADDEAHDLGLDLAADADFVNNLFRVMLGRSPSVQELATQTGRIPSESRGQLVLDLIHDTAAYNGSDAVRQADRSLFNQKVTVALSYNRDLDPAQTAGYSLTVGRALLAAVTPGATMQVALDAAVQKLGDSITAASGSSAAADLAAHQQPLEELHLQLARLYVSVLGRAPDKGGLDYWSDVIWSGAATLEAVATNLVFSTESSVGMLANADYVRAIYGSAIGRAPNDAELAQWTTRLESSSRGQVALDIADSLLNYRGTSASELALQALLRNRTAVAETFATIMGGNNAAIAREIVARVTTTDVGAALAYGAQSMAQIIAENTKNQADAAAAAARLEQDAAGAVSGDLGAAQDAASAAAAASAAPAAAALGVAQLYVGLLLRGQPGHLAADFGGLSFFVSTMQQGSSLRSVAQNMLDSDEGRALFAAGQSGDDFVRQLYAQVLGRAATGADVAFWSGQLSQGATRGALAADLIQSFLTQYYQDTNPDKAAELDLRAKFNDKVGAALAAMEPTARAAIDQANAAIAAVANAAAAATAASQAGSSAGTYVSNTGPEVGTALAISRLYVGVLNRGPGGTMPLDLNGLSYWINAARTSSTATMANMMLQNDEGKALFANATSNTAFLGQLCQQVLGRSATAAESDLLAQLDQGASRGSVAAALIDRLGSLAAADPAEQARRAAFDTRVSDALKQVDPTAVNSAQAAADALASARTSLAAAQTALTNAAAALDAAKALTVDSDPQVIAADAAAAQANAVEYSPYLGIVVDMWTAFGHPVTFDGLVAAIGRFPANASDATVKSVMAGLAAECVGPYTATVDGRTQFISALYLQVLHRQADVDGLNYWLAQDLGSDAGTVAYNFYVGARQELDSTVTIARNNFAGECSNATTSLRNDAQAYIDAAAAARVTAQNAINSAIASAQATYDSKASAYNQAVTNVATAQAALNDANTALSNAQANVNSTYDAYMAAGNAYYYPSYNTDPYKEPNVVAAKAAMETASAYQNSSNYSPLVEMLTAFGGFSVASTKDLLTKLDAGQTTYEAVAGALAGPIGGSLADFVRHLYAQILHRSTHAVNGMMEEDWWVQDLAGLDNGTAALRFYKSALNELYGDSASRPFPSEVAASRSTFDQDVTSYVNAYYAAVQQANATIDAERNQSYTLFQNAYNTYVAAQGTRDTAQNTVNSDTAAYNAAVGARDQAKGPMDDAAATLATAKAATVDSDPNVIAADAKAAVGRAVLNNDTSQIVSIMVAFGDAAPSVDVVNSLIGQAPARVAGRYVGALNDSTRQSFVENLYTTVLHRAADPAGLAYWMDVSHGYTDQGQFAFDFYTSSLDELNLHNAELHIVRTTWAAELAQGRSTAIGACDAARNNDAATRAAVTQRLADGVTSAQGVYDKAVSDKSNADQALLHATLDAAIAAEAYAITADQALVTSAQAAATVTALMSTLRVQTGVKDLAATQDALQAELTVLQAQDPALTQDIAVSHAQSLLATADAGVARTRQAIANAPFLSAQDVKVAQYYQVLLGRAPTVQEYSDAIVRLQIGGGLDALVERIMAKNPDAFPAGMSNDDFVSRLYANGLSRDFSNDPNGLHYWSDQLSGPGAISRAALTAKVLDSFVVSNNADTVTFETRMGNVLTALADAFKAITNDPTLYEQGNASALHAAEAAADAGLPTSQMAQDETALTRLYIGLFGRAPDGAGLDYWLGALQGGETLANAAQAILASGPEGMSAYPASLTDDEFVQRVIETGLGRPATAAEIAGYAAQLQSQSRGQVALGIINDAAAYHGGALAEENARTRLNAKVNAALRDTAADADGFIGDLHIAQQVAEAIDAARPVLHTVDLVTASEITVQGDHHANAPANKYTVDRWGNVRSVTDARNPAWKISYTYGADNQVLSTTLPDAGQGPSVSKVAYDELGRAVKTTDARGNVSTKGYDADGNLVREGHADGGYATYKVDAFGQRTNAFQSYYNADTLNPAHWNDTGTSGILTAYAFDHLGHLTSTTSGAVDVYSATDNSATSPTSAMYATASTTVRIVTTYTYDALGRQTGIAIGDSASTVVASNSTTRYDLSGNVIESGSYDHLTHSAYDAANHLKWQQDAETGSMSWHYDVTGRLLTHTNLAGAGITYRYSGAGQVLSESGGGIDRRYTYDSVSGRLVRIEDAKLSKVTTYGYDEAGNRTAEKTVQAGKIVQDQTIEFDAQGRISKVHANVSGADYEVAYTYDLAGNRKHVETSYTSDGGDQNDIAMDNEFDAMNRQISSTSTVDTINDFTSKLPSYKWDQIYGDEPRETHTTETHSVTYDGVGNRVRDSVSTDGASAEITGYSYDAAGRLSAVTQNNTQVGYRRYDAAGRVVENLNDGELQTMAYDQYGNMLRQSVRGSDGSHKYDIYYTGPGGAGSYDKLGNLLGYDVATGTAIDRNNWSKHYSMAFSKVGDAWRQGTEVVTDRNGGSANTINEYDINGELSKVSKTQSGNTTTIRLINDAQGKVLSKTAGGLVTHSLIVNDQLVGSSDNNFESFSTTFEPVTSSAMTASPSVYLVQTGDTLESIAKSLWGDATLWFLISDANGGIGNTAPQAGQTLAIPARASTTRNDFQTFKAYDPNTAVGDTTPSLAEPSSGGGGDGGCGGLGQILMIVVAVAATLYTAGLLAPYFAAGSAAATAATAATTIGGTMTAGALALTEGSLSIIGGALAGAAGSIASQTVGIATGEQNGYDWRGVALGAIGGGIGAGLGQYGPAAWVGPNASPGWVAARAATASALTQGVAVATGLQDSFSWRSVAASAAGAGVGTQVGSAVSDSSALGNVFGHETVRHVVDSTISGFAAGMTTAVFKGGKLDIQRVATDAFGNALGHSLVDTQNNKPIPSKLDQGNGIFKGTDENRKILNDRGIPFIELPNGSQLPDLYFGSLDRSGSFVQVEGSRVVTLKSYRGDDGSIVYASADQHGNYTVPPGAETIDVKELRYGETTLGRDYGPISEWTAAIEKAGVTAGDPAYSLRRQVAVDPIAHPELAAFIDPGTGQVNPLQWKQFEDMASKADIPMVVSSNGLGNYYQQGRDNIRILAEGKDALAINVYNPTIDGGFMKDGAAEAVLANLFGQKQTVQVAIQSQMRDALAYNAALDDAHDRATPTLTGYVGHSQGTINGNLAIDQMNEYEKQLIHVYSVGTASWHLPQGVAGFTSIVDANDPVTKWTAGRAISDDQYALQHPDTYTKLETNIDGIPGMTDAGNHHSFYLYAQSKDFQAALGFVSRSAPIIITRPFAK